MFENLTSVFESVKLGTLRVVEASDAFTPVLIASSDAACIYAVRYEDSACTRALPSLTVQEQRMASQIGGARIAAFTAGRISVRNALRMLRSRHYGSTIEWDSFGAPRPPAGYVASITHKDGIAIGVAAADEGYRIGIDLDSFVPELPRLRSRVLAAPERDGGNCWRETLARLCVKEAVFKAAEQHFSESLLFRNVIVRFQGLPDSASPILRPIDVSVVDRAEAVELRAAYAIHDRWVFALAGARRSVDDGVLRGDAAPRITTGSTAFEQRQRVADPLA